jgi:plasmid stabilization system protein ParE
MAYEIVYSPRAMRDLEAIEAYLIERSPSGARNVMAAIKHAIEGLTDFPRIGSPIDDEHRYRLPIRRYPYAIFYRVTSREVLILHIRHGARRPIEANQL